MLAAKEVRGWSLPLLRPSSSLPPMLKYDPWRGLMRRSSLAAVVAVVAVSAGADATRSSWFPWRLDFRDGTVSIIVGLDGL